MLVLESCPTQTIELFLSGNIPADLVNSYLKQHAPNMQATYLELMLAMDENGISGNLQNEMVKRIYIYLTSYKPIAYPVGGGLKKLVKSVQQIFTVYFGYLTVIYLFRVNFYRKGNLTNMFCRCIFISQKYLNGMQI